MKTIPILTAFILTLLAVTAGAQQPDYLTREEVQLARETQEPNKRIQLFLKFADQRLGVFEKNLASGPEGSNLNALKDRVSDFIRAVDDTSDNVRQAVERGGADLRPARTRLMPKGEEFKTRLETIQKTYQVAQSEDLRYDLEDAVEAVQEMIDLGNKIPTIPIPAKAAPEVAGPGETEAPATAGKPTLKRRSDKPKDEKPKPDKPN